MAKKTTDERLIGLILAHGVSGAAAIAGVSKNSIYKRLKNPIFRAEYDSAQGIILSATTGALCDALGDAVTSLRDIVNDKSTSAGLRVQAASALLSHGVRYVEVSNIMRRLEALEKKEGEENGER